MKGKKPDEAIVSIRELLHQTINIFYSNIKNRNMDFLKDVWKYEKIIYDESYDFAIESFWNYFREKYDLSEELRVNYIDLTSCIVDVYRQCIHPLSLDMDNYYMGMTFNKGDIKYTLRKKWKNLKSWFDRFWIDFLGIGGFFALLIISFTQYNQNIWLSFVLMGISTGIFTAYIIRFLNQYVHVKKLIKDSEIKQIERTIVRFIKDFYKYYDVYRSVEVQKDKYKKMLEFVNIDNLIHHFVQNADKLKKSYKDFTKLKKLDPKIFEVSSRVVKGMHFKEHSYNELDIDKFDVFIMEIIELVKSLEQESKSKISRLKYEINLLDKKRI